MRIIKTTNLVRVFYWVFIIVPILLTASCGGTTTPITENPLLSTPQQQASDWPDSIKKIAAGQQLRFDHISLEQGLSQSTVFCMLQDRHGFIWFGTEDGLNKYDGYTFIVYKNDPDNSNSLSDNWILTMLEDRAGTLWVGTREGGLEHYDREHDQFTHYQNDPEDPTSLSNNEITAIYQDQKGVIWIGTGDGGLNRFDQEKETFAHYQHDPGNPNSLSSNAVAVIFEDQEGGFWVGTEDGGLNKFDRETELWWHYRNNPGDPDSLSHNTIKAIFEDASGVLWVGTNGGGMDRFDQENDQFIHFQHDPGDPETLSGDIIAAIYQDRDGMLWVGTIGSGLNRYDSETETFTRYQHISGDQHSLSNNYIISILQDREGVLWFGTFGAGINKLNTGWMNFANFQNDANNTNSLSDNMVRALFADNDNALWIGTLDRGVDRFDRENNSWRNFPYNPDDFSSLSNSFVSAMYEDQSGILWIGTGSGLDRYEPETGTFTHFQPDPDATPGSLSNNVRTIYESPEGQFWIGTKGGLYRFDHKQKSWSHHYYHDHSNPHSLSEDWIFSILEDKDGRIWLGTVGGGLNSFDPEKETFTYYKNNPDDPHSLSNNFVMSIFQDREGALWIGTPGGLDRFDPEAETFTHYQEKDGLPNNTIYCILEDTQGYLWFSTNKGLSRFDPQRETFRNYDVTDGLQSNEFNGNACHTNDNGEMFFGGIDGFNAFFPDQIEDNSTIPPVVLTSLVHSGEHVYLDNTGEGMMEVTLKWPENAFEFEYAALSFAQPEKNQYAYYLEGFEETWNNVGGRRYGLYTNLSGGSYTLRVKGSNNDGVWNETGTSLRVTVVPPFWATWWFRGVMLFTLLGVVYGSYRLRVRNLEARERELESQVKQRTTELIETQVILQQTEMEKAVSSERSRLARDLHDSVTQTIFSMTLTTEATRQLLERDPSRLPSQLDRLQELSKSALAEMRSLIFELRPTTASEMGLVPALRKHILTLDKQNKLDITLDVVGEPDLTGNQSERLFRITQEALNNVAKHAQVDKASVVLRFEDEVTSISIDDQGQGFNPETVDSNRNQMGLSSMHERVVMLGGTLSIDSQPGKGTSVKVLVPVTKK
jgi:signal transduction histidine kinase/ligand-binding sensor domain-containing protein